jgi:hypothetical protein
MAETSQVGYKRTEAVDQAVTEPTPIPHYEHSDSSQTTDSGTKKIEHEFIEATPIKPMTEHYPEFQKEPLSLEEPSVIDSGHSAFDDSNKYKPYTPRPVDYGYTEPMMIEPNFIQPQMQPPDVFIPKYPCTVCGQPLEFIHQYQKYYCHSCNNYFEKQY